MAPLSFSIPNYYNNLNRDDHLTPSRTAQDAFSDAGIPSLELSADNKEVAPPDRLSQYLESLGLGGEIAEPEYGGLLRRGVATSPLSPRDIGILGRGVVVPRDTTHNRGAGTVGPTSINNKGMLALFGLLFSGLIISAIWFFFWAKNGGFEFKEGDWEEYKSTVLRRKGPNGTTLSGATKTTDLGQQSVTGSFDAEDAEEEHVRDNDVRQYRHEKPAKVGGINREPDGSYYDRDSTDRSSEVTAEPSAAGGKRGFWRRSEKPSAGGSRSKGNNNNNNAANRQPSTTYSFTEGDDGTIVSGATEYTRPTHTHRSSRHHSHRPSSHHRHRNSAGAPPSSSRHHTHTHHPPPTTISEVSYDDDTTSELGTKIYNHSVPGLLAGSAVATTRSEVSYEPSGRGWEGASGKGYRRGGGRRRDSLSESEGETVG
ncbi:MAG: hypothetical protein M1813_005111 [Trichoglossum hirsutum]|nr:MAG: hypothetical protein M1813_005111 [Trichoglossum hirsutum]